MFDASRTSQTATLDSSMEGCSLFIIISVGRRCAPTTCCGCALDGTRRETVCLAGTTQPSLLHGWLLAASPRARSTMKSRSMRHSGSPTSPPTGKTSGRCQQALHETVVCNEVQQCKTGITHKLSLSYNQEF